MKTLCPILLPLLALGLFYSPTTPVAAEYTELSTCRTIRLEIEPAAVGRGEPVTIKVVLEKTGDGALMCPAVLAIDNVTAGQQDIWYAATRCNACSVISNAATQEAVFTVTKDTPGTYSVVANGLTGLFTVTENTTLTLSPQPSSPLATVLSSEIGSLPVPSASVRSSPDNRFLIGIIVAMVPVLSTVIFFLMKKRAGIRPG